ncbi:probable sphingolipid transporter spinster homolog 2 [Rhododendron vialii]|uniref:probable sphingolipid transporter spinster homolog 2 n=1 Tax=Rhododendron vialii TaxID=182163 RepID=UPI00265DF8F9|nr:probable sphingolipid transporter spinster homolog 2 [Rhododendron vialii]
MARVSSEATWFTPIRLLVTFSLINFINFVHRGAVASNGVNGSPKICTPSGQCTPGSGIQGALNLSNFQDGFLSSAFMIGLIVASPIFASLVKSYNPFRLIGVGLTVWTFAIAGSGFPIDFWFIIACRVLVGVGIAPFVSIGAPYIDDIAPLAQKATWLGIFYTCIPAGFSVGYVYGGLVGDNLGWRYAFFGLAIVMSPFAVIGFLAKPLKLKANANLFVDTGCSPTEMKKASSSGAETSVSEAKGVFAVIALHELCFNLLFLNSNDMTIRNLPFISYDSTGNDGAERPVKEEIIDQDSKGPSKIFVMASVQAHSSRFVKDLKVLLLDKVYVVNVLGNIAYNFVLGAYSYWGPKAGYGIYQMKNADMIFGGVTMVCGIVGTLAGGFVLDKMTSTISNAFKLLFAATFIGAALCFSAFCFKSLYVFIALFTVGELLLFGTQGPVNFICLQCVQPSMRPISMAMSVVAIHVFGDVPSAPLVGVLQDYLKDWRKTTLILTSILFLAAIIWFIGIFLYKGGKSNGDSENQVAMVSKSNETPVVDEMAIERTNSSSAKP